MLFSEFLSLQVPHALALIEPLDRLCVADRENMRVTCPRAGLYSIEGKKEPALTIQQPDMGRVFGVAAKGEPRQLFIVTMKIYHSNNMVLRLKMNKFRNNTFMKPSLLRIVMSGVQ